MVERTALVRRPSLRLGDGIVTHIERRAVDAALAARQHEAYVDALETAGRHLRWSAPADDLPDAVFVEDTVVVCDDLAVLAPVVDISEFEKLEGCVTCLSVLIR